jgi:integrase
MNYKVNLRGNPSRDKKKIWWRLDFSPKIRDPQTGKLQRFKSLGIYTFKLPRTEFDRQHNNEMKRLMENLQLDIRIKLINNDINFLQKSSKDKDFLEYFLSLAEKRRSSTSNFNKWMVVYKYLKEFSSTIRFNDVDRVFANKFGEYLLNRKHNRIEGQNISPNSAASYFTKFLYTLKQAYKDGHLDKDIAVGVDRIKTEETNRVFLTYEEVKNLINTECKDLILKQACLFMVYTGLRVSDAETLKWENIEESEESGNFIRFKQVKTKSHLTLPISKEAFELLGERGNNEDIIFPKFKRSYSNLKLWAKDAGINKKLSFHCFRRTSGTLLLNSGVDIFTVKELLGHKDIKTTLRYVQLLSKNKVKAVNQISFSV